MGPDIDLICKREHWRNSKMVRGRVTNILKIYTMPGREANNFGICILSIPLSSNLVKIHTSGVNRINIWLPGPGDTTEN